MPKPSTLRLRRRITRACLPDKHKQAMLQSLQCADQIREYKELLRGFGGRRTTADSAAENRCPELNVIDTSAAYCGATKGRQASRNSGSVNGDNASTAYGRYRSPILDNILSLRFAMNELLLNIVVLGRNCRQNERQNAKNTDQTKHCITVGSVKFPQRVCSRCVVIAFDQEVHDSHSIGALGSAENVCLRQSTPATAL